LSADDHFVDITGQFPNCAPHEDFPVPNLTHFLIAAVIVFPAFDVNADQPKVEVPPGTVVLDLDTKGGIRSAGQDEPFPSQDEVQKYLAGKFATASELVKKAEGGKARPVVLIRIRELVDAGRIELLQKLCNKSGYRWAVDIEITADAIRKLGEPSPGSVILSLDRKGEAKVAGQKHPLRTLDDFRKYLKEQALRAKAEGMAAKIEDTPIILILGPREAQFGELVKMIVEEDEKLGYVGHWFFWVESKSFTIEPNAPAEK